MQWNFNKIASLLGIVSGIYGAITKDIFILNYGMLGSIICINWEIMRNLEEKNV